MQRLKITLVANCYAAHSEFERPKTVITPLINLV